MSGWWLADWWNGPHGPVIVVSWVVWVIGSIVLHELSHGWAALRLGDPTPRATGHMTWNPLVHMGTFSLLAFLFIGIAWGVMPVDPSRLRGRHGDALVAAAGPAMNLLLAIVAIVGGGLWLGLAGNVPDPLRTNMLLFLFVGAALNLVLMLFNLIPAPPLDGSRILASFSAGYRRLLYSENGRWVALGVFLLVFFLGGPYLFGAGFLVTRIGFGVIGGVIDAVTGMGIPSDALPI